MLLGTQDRDFFPQDLTEKFKFVKSIGFECFEIDGKVLKMCIRDRLYNIL